MKEIVERLQEQRQVELAKSILESNGYSVKSTKLKEGNELIINIYISPSSTDLSDEEDNRLYDLSANGLELSPKDPDFPMPWDAGCSIHDGFFIISGDFGQQGSHRGWAKVGIPLDKVDNYLDITIHANNAEDLKEITQILQSHNWEIQ